MVGLAVTLLACTATVAGARTTYTTSKPAVSNAPKKDRPFVTSGYITPKSRRPTAPPSRSSSG